MGSHSGWRQHAVLGDSAWQLCVCIHVYFFTCAVWPTHLYFSNNLPCKHLKSQDILHFG